MAPSHVLYARCSRLLSLALCRTIACNTDWVQEESPHMAYQKGMHQHLDITGFATAARKDGKLAPRVQ